VSSSLVSKFIKRGTITTRFKDLSSMQVKKCYPYRHNRRLALRFKDLRCSAGESEMRRLKPLVTTDERFRQAYEKIKERKRHLRKLLGKERREKLKRLWDKQKVLACDVRGWGWGLAIEKAREMGVPNPDAIIYSVLLPERQRVVGKINVGNNADGGENFDPLWDEAYSFNELCEMVGECLEKNYDNIWVEIVGREKDSLIDTRGKLFVVKGKIWNDRELRWESEGREYQT